MAISEIVQLMLLPPAAYALGSIPSGLVLTRAFTSVDPRKAGSGNIGATNVRRTAGNLLGVCTLVGDLLKGAVPVGYAARLVGAGASADVYLAIVAFCAFMGHLYPVYTGFRGGGKGVATAAGCFLALSPAAATVGLLVFVLFFCLTGRASVGSLAAIAMLPLAVWKAAGSGPLTACACAIGVWVWWRHRENLRRLLAGTEPKA